MPYFLWSGSDAQGAPKSGAIEANSTSEATQSLRTQNVFNTQLTSLSSHTTQKPLSHRLTTELLSHWHRLFSSGLSLVPCLELLIQSIKDPTLKLVLSFVKQDLEAGHSVKQALSRFPKYFPKFMIHLMGVAEKTGELEKVLEQLHAFFQTRQKLLEERHKALIYPLILLGVGIGLVLGLLIWVVPAFENMFLANADNLLWSTQLLLTWSQHLQAHPLLWLSGGALTLGLMIFLKVSGKAKEWGGQLPGIRHLLWDTNLAFYAHSLAMSLESNISFKEALSLAESLFEKEEQQHFSQIHQMIERGIPVTQAYQQASQIPDNFMQLIQVGESSGDLGAAYGRVALFYEEEALQTLQRINKLIEPVFMILFALLLMGILTSIYLPMFDAAGRF